jgi:hypothetical protein
MKYLLVRRKIEQRPRSPLILDQVSSRSLKDEKEGSIEDFHVENLRR